MVTNRKGYMKKYRDENTERIKEARKRFYENHPGIQSEYMARWREAHREEYNAYHREYHRRRKAKKVD